MAQRPRLDAKQALSHRSVCNAVYANQSRGFANPRAGGLDDRLNPTNAGGSTVPKANTSRAEVNLSADMTAADVLKLRANRADILLKFKALSVAPTMRLTHEPAEPNRAGSKPPPGYREDSNGPPDRDTEPYLHYLWQFEKHKKSITGTRCMLVIARADYARRTGRDDDDALGPSLNETPEQKDARIILDYEGYSPREVAIIERCNAESVRRLRRLELRRPADGKRDTALSERDARILTMVANGARYRTIAHEFDISHQRVAQIVAKAGVGAEAVY